VYLRRYPSSVARIMLEGVAPIDDKVPLGFARGAQKALRSLEADCAADPTCHQSFPNFAREFEVVNARINKRPLRVFVTGTGGKTLAVTLTHQVFVDRLRQMMYSSEGAGYVPLLIREAYRGNTRLLANTLLFMGRGLESGIAQGMFLSVTCAEDIPFIDEREIREQTRGTFYGDARIRAQQAACRTWNVKPAPRSFLQRFKSDVPALFLSGADDPATPPWFAKALLRDFARGRQVVFPHSGHELAGVCFNAIAVKFADTGKVDAGETCAGGLKRPAFATSLPAFLR